jgi:hypothetical protein
MTLDLANLSPAPWKVGREIYDNWGTVRDATGKPVASTCFHAQADFDAFRRTHQFGTPEHDRGPEPIPTNAEFIALARIAFDVMMRRGWHAEQSEDGSWFVPQAIIEMFAAALRGAALATHHADPFAALVAAEEWYKANVEKSPAP